jgi:hypothetical protein
VAGSASRISLWDFAPISRWRRSATQMDAMIDLTAGRVYEVISSEEHFQAFLVGNVCLFLVQLLDATANIATIGFWRRSELAYDGSCVIFSKVRQALSVIQSIRCLLFCPSMFALAEGFSLFGIFFPQDGQKLEQIFSHFLLGTSLPPKVGFKVPSKV